MNYGVGGTRIARRSVPSEKTVWDYSFDLRAEIMDQKADVIDLFKINPIDPADCSLVSDGLHPNDEGHKILAKVVAQELLKL